MLRFSAENLKFIEYFADITYNTYIYNLNSLKGEDNMEAIYYEK